MSPRHQLLPILALLLAPAPALSQELTVDTARFRASIAEGQQAVCRYAQFAGLTDAAARPAGSCN